MRLVEMMQIAGAILGSTASTFAVIEKRLLMLFRRADATSAENAIEIPRVNALIRWRLSRLKAIGALGEVDDHRIYLNEAAYASLRRRRAVVGISLVVAVLTLVVLLHAALN
jgi:hypothetical protein